MVITDQNPFGSLLHRVTVFIHHSSTPRLIRFQGLSCEHRKPTNSSRREMLQELSHMDRITQLQDEIQQVRFPFSLLTEDGRESTECLLILGDMRQILVIMSNTISYLTTRTNFLQVSAEIPVTKQRKPDKFDAPDVFEG